MGPMVSLSHGFFPKIAVAALVFTALVLSGCGAGASSEPQPTQPAQSEPSSDEFTVVVLPDTQCYTSGGAPQQPGDCGGQGTMAMFNAQMDWILRNRSTERIQVVIGVGDIVQCGSNTQEWDLADQAYRKLDQAGIPYVSVIGNHDYEADCGTGSLRERSSTAFNKYFGPSRVSSYSWYGSSTFPDHSNENFYVMFNAVGRKYLVIALELYPRDAALAWAEQVMQNHVDREVIISTHAYLTSTGSRVLDDDSLGPAKYGLTADNNGVEMWDKLFRKHRNLIAVVDGHFRGASTRVDPGDSGNRVAQMHSNYQFEGGQGYLRILRFRPGSRTIAVRTFSPFLNSSKTDEKNQFTINYGSQ